MTVPPLQQLVRAIVPLLRSRGLGRWLATFLIVGALGLGWWRPDLLFSLVSPETPQSTADSRSEAFNTAAQPDAADGADATGRAAGQLRDEGRGVFRSPAGLVYTRGSQQGHRIKHVMAHSRDEPERAGQHGVFSDGRQTSVIALIDEAYERAQAGEATRRRQDRERTILTVDVGRVIGYIGGQSGNRRGRPPAHHVRLVLEDHRVITAYPVIP